MTDDDDTITLHITMPGGCPDDYQVFWRGLPVGRIMGSTGFPSQAPQWCWVASLCWHSSLQGESGHGNDLGNSEAKFRMAWARIRARLTDSDIAKAQEMQRP
jgi:hypothetical protein